VKVYLDTGVFVDYLSYPSYLVLPLRKKGRRNRSIQQLQQDVNDCLSKISKKHEGFTSCLALYEAEEALFARLLKAAKGAPHGRNFAISSSRPLITQILTVKKLFNLRILDLTETTFQDEIKNINLQIEGIRAGDSLHMVTAILNDADMVITTDKHLIGLKNKFLNSKNSPITCYDTNQAKQFL
jgi:hypothetical protein